MYNKILVPLDGSQRSEMIIPYVQNFAKGANVNIVLTQVVEPVIRNIVVDLDKPNDAEVAFPPQKVNHIRDYLLHWKENFEQQGFRAETLLLQGVAVPAILEAIKMVKADLVAMTFQGKSGIARVFYGSVTAGVINRAPCPLFLTRSNLSKKSDGIKRVLVPLDGSVRAEKVLPYITAIARYHQAEIVILQVVLTNYQITTSKNIDTNLNQGSGSHNLFNQLGEVEQLEHIQSSRKYLVNMEAQLQNQGFNVQSHLMYGRATESIIALADQVSADLIAITNQGRTGLSKVLYGSVALGVLNNGSHPLLIVPTNSTD